MKKKVIFLIEKDKLDKFDLVVKNLDHSRSAFIRYLIDMWLIENKDTVEIICKEAEEKKRLSNIVFADKFLNDIN